jgi:N-acetyl-D-muramate 6-phosphate phosphatase
VRFVIEAVLFDLDGTLLDTAPDLVASTHYALKTQGLVPRADIDLRGFVSGGARGLVLGAQLEALDVDRAMADLLAHYASNISVASAPFSGVMALLDALDAKRVRWGIVTNKSTELTHLLRRHQPLLARTEVLVCGDTLAVRKPDPAPLLHAAALLGSAPENTIYVGDDRRDMLAAQAAGMPGVIALWGYLGAEPDPLAWPHWRACVDVAELQRQLL